MPIASSIPSLLDFETNIEDALRTFLLGSTYFGAAHQVLTPRTLASTEAVLETPRVTLALTITGSGPQELQRNTDSALYQAQRLGSLQIIAIARRDASGQALGTMRGKIRKAMLDATAALDSTALPYYNILTAIEGGSQSSADAENDEIAWAVTYVIEFIIRPDVWPAS